MSLDRYERAPFHAAGFTFDVYRRGTGPGVVVMAEIPGITPNVIAFADALVDAGMSVAMPSLFGVDGRAPTMPRAMAALGRACVRREFAAFALAADRPITKWLTAVARDLHGAAGGPGVGAVGMCFTGGFALAMMVDPSVIAPVLSQPSLPLGGRRRSADIGVGDQALKLIQQRIEDEGCAVRALRFTGDPMVKSARFEAYREAFGDAFQGVELPSPDESWNIGKLAHSVLTEEVDRADPAHPATIAMHDTVRFLADRLGVGEPGAH